MPRLVRFTSGALRSGPAPTGPTGAMWILHEFIGGARFSALHPRRGTIRHRFRPSSRHAHARSACRRRQARAEPFQAALLELSRRFSTGRFWRKPKRAVEARPIV